MSFFKFIIHCEKNEYLAKQENKMIYYLINTYERRIWELCKTYKSKIRKTRSKAIEPRIIDERRHFFVNFVCVAEHDGHDGSNEVIADEALKH